MGKPLVVFPDGPLKPIHEVTDLYTAWQNGKHKRKAAEKALKKSWREKRKWWRREKFKTAKIRIYGLPGGENRKYYRNVYLKSEHWKKLRFEKLKASPKCEDCGQFGNVEPHHLRYKNLYDVEPEDLKTLCRKCHIKEHEKLDRWKRAAKVAKSGLNPRQGLRRWRSIAEFRNMPTEAILGVEAECKITGPVPG